VSDILTNRLSIYLIREEYSTDEEIFLEPDQLTKSEIGNFGFFYYAESKKFQPSWLTNFFGSSLSETQNIYNANTKGVLLVPIETKSSTRIFAIPFGYGRNLIKPGIWEERFGLEIAPKIIMKDKLRKIDRRRIDTTPKIISEQLGKVGEIYNFEIDSELDIVTSVTGKTEEKKFGSTITGKEAFSISAKVDHTNIKKFLLGLYELYISTEYKANFELPKQFLEVKDKEIIKELNNQLIEHIEGEQYSKIWMVIPDIVDWHDIGFSFKESGKELKDDISPKDFILSLSDYKRRNLSIDVLREKYIYCFSLSSESLVSKWNAYSCLYGEIQNDKENSMHLLLYGKWHEVESDYVVQVNRDFKKLYDASPIVNLPAYHHKNEKDYNTEVAKQDQNFCCMDEEIIIDNSRYGQIEFCDLFTKNNEIIHVQRYRKSRGLSHLFFQGLVSGEAFKMDEEFQEAVNKELCKSHKINVRDISTSKFQIIYAIINMPSGDLKFPFFSKISLRTAESRLRALGYKVALQKIDKEDSKKN